MIRIKAVKYKEADFWIRLSNVPFIFFPLGYLDALMRLYLNRLNIRGRKKNIVAIYQMGKVASTSITNSIYSHYNGYALSDHGLVIRCYSCLRELTSFKKNLIYGFMNSFTSPSINPRRVDSIALYLLSKRKSKIKIISLFREPIERALSKLFQLHHEKFITLPFNQQKEEFLSKSHLHLVGPTIWFDKEIKQYFNIDVYTRPFPKEQGYDFYKNEWGAELLLMRYNLNDRTKEKLIEEFIGIKDFKLINKNISANKPYANAYEAFKRELKLPLWYIDKVKNSKYFNHFYSKEFIEQNCNRWLENI